MKKVFNAGSRYADGFKYLKTHCLNTRRLCVRPLKERDSKAYLALLEKDNREYLKFINWDKCDLQMTDEWAKFNSLHMRKTWGLEATLFIFPKGSQKIIGSVIAFRSKQNIINIGYFLSSDYRGNGYAREAVKAVVHSIKIHEPHQPILAEVLPENKASLRLLRSIGFEARGRWQSKCWPPEINQPFLTVRLS